MSDDRKPPPSPLNSPLRTGGGFAGKVPATPSHDAPRECGYHPANDTGAEEQAAPPRQRAGDRDRVAAADARIAEAFERIVASWVKGAELPPAERGDAIDQSVRAGDLTELTAALIAREQAASDDYGQMQQPAAVRLKGTAIGDLWLIADFDVLTEEPDIAVSGIPVFTFVEFTQLVGKGIEALRAAAVVRRLYPTAAIVDDASVPPLPDGTVVAIRCLPNPLGYDDGQNLPAALPAIAETPCARATGTGLAQDAAAPPIELQLPLFGEAASRHRAPIPTSKPRAPKAAEPPPPPGTTGTRADGYFCPHISEASRQAEANRGRTVRCSDCFVAAHPDWRPKIGRFFGSIADLKAYAESLRRRRDAGDEDEDEE